MKKLSIALSLLFALLPLSACHTTPRTLPPPVTESPVLPQESELPQEPELSQEPVPQEPVLPQETEPKEPAPAAAEYVRVRVNGLNVRTGAGTRNPSLGTAEADVLLHFGGSEAGWYSTLYRGKAAYVSADPAYTEKVLLPCGGEETERVIAEGLRLLGTPYVYGAVRFCDGKGNRLRNFTEEAFDCSSLMQYIFWKGAGIVLDVTTRTQVLQGEHVSRGELTRGDLLFFTNASRYGKTGIERVGHVGLYLGENYILHTASDYAKIEQISPKRWSYFLEGRRML